MITSEKLTQIQDFLSSAQTIAVVYGSDATIDQMAVATSLHLALQASEKDSRLLSPQLPESNQLSGLDQTATELGNQNLSISFEYSEDAVDKVSYHIGEETGKFYLTIKPKKGEKPLDANSVELTYTGADMDVIILVGIQNFEELEQLYYGYENDFQKAAIITIDTYEPNFGTVKVDLSSAASLSEEIAQLILNLGYQLPAEAATNLLAGIEHATNRFQSMSATAQTFEMVSQLMRLGARRIRMMSPVAVAPAKQTQQEPVTVRQEKSGEVTQVKQPSQSENKQSHTDQTQAKGQSHKKKKNKQPDKNQTKPGGLKYQPSGFSTGN